MSNCSECNEPFVECRGIEETLVGSASPPGHDHNNNCMTGHMYCANGHRTFLPLRRKCCVEGCDWKGKEKCFCHKGPKVEEWPEVFQKAYEHQYLKPRGLI